MSVGLNREASRGRGLTVSRSAPARCCASRARRREKGSRSAAGGKQGVRLWPLERTHQPLPLSPLTQGKLASFFLSRVDALSPQLQQVKGREGGGEPGDLSWSFCYSRLSLSPPWDCVPSSLPFRAHGPHSATSASSSRLWLPASLSFLLPSELSFLARGGRGALRLGWSPI